MAFLQFVQDGNCLALKAGTEPCGQFLHGADPLTGIYRITDTEIGPVVYLRNGTDSPLATYSEMAVRWGISKATTGRVLKKLADMDYISLMSFPGRTGSVIYLHSYFSTMFQIYFGHRKQEMPCASRI